MRLMLFDNGRWRVPYQDRMGAAILKFFRDSGFEINNGSASFNGLVDVMPPEGWNAVRNTEDQNGKEKVLIFDRSGLARFECHVIASRGTAHIRAYTTIL